MYQKFLIEKDYSHVYNFLKSNGISERYMSFLRKELGYIRKNGNPVTIKEPLSCGDELEIIADNNSKTEIKTCILPLDIVYDDAYYLLINKPSGITTIPTRSHYDVNLAGAVQHLNPGAAIRIVNRLDKDTAGLVLFAKNLLASNTLSSVKKTYYALCEGRIDKPITIDSPIKTLIENGINVRKRVISDEGKAAKTFVEPVKEYDGFTLLKITLQQGRTHQIRVHLSSIGHPLLGDTLYGSADPRIGHTALICKEFSFFHPFLKQELSFSVDFPEDFQRLLTQNS